jgi:hypothetical protein
VAAPNIVNVTTITGKTAVANASTVATAFVTNSAASNKVFKVNSLYVSNIDGAAAATITVDLLRSAVAYNVLFTVNVPADSTLDVLSKPIYLEEGDALRSTASANGDLQVICSYEEIS